MSALIYYSFKSGLGGIRKRSAQHPGPESQGVHCFKISDGTFRQMWGSGDVT